MNRGRSVRSVSGLSAAVFLGLVSLFGSGLQADVTTFGLEAAWDERLVEISSVFSVSSAQAGKTYSAALVVDIQPDWHINSARPHQGYLIPAELSFDTTSGIVPHSPAWPEGSDVSLAGEVMSVYDGRVIIPFQVTLDEGLAAGDYDLPIRFTYQPCNDKECRAPETDAITLSVSVGGEGSPVHAEIFAGVETSVGPAGSTEGPVTDESDLQRLIDDYGFWGYFLALGLAFLTGLLLSFSPCTYPMIPITVSIFAGQQRSLGRGFVLSLFYVGSMAVVYGIMGLIVSLVGGVFGAWLASPPVIIGIVVVFVVFALSMFGLYELQVPSSLRQKLGTTRAGSGIIGSIILGVIAALVVSPCVGPFVAGILLYLATTGSPVVGFFVLFVFALGLGTLFVIIGTFSTAINSLPGSGAWMESVKRFFGFVLLLMALYFLDTLVSPTLIAILLGLLLISFGVFGGGFDRLTAEAGFFLRLKKLLGVLALLVGGYLLLGVIITQGLVLPPAAEWLPRGAATAVPEEQQHIAWETDLETGLARARSEGKPVLIDTWATWCVNCRVLDRKTFGNAEVAAEAEKFVPIKVQLETANSPTTKAFMKRFKIKQYSLPTTLLLDSTGRLRRMLQGVVGPDEMLAEMRRL